MCDKCNIAREESEAKAGISGAFMGRPNQEASRPISEDEIIQKLSYMNKEVTQYHKPSRAGIAAIRNIRLAAEHFMNVIDSNIETGADVVDAKRKVHEAMMTANKAIALGGSRG